MLKRTIDATHRIHMLHNTIHRIMAEGNMAVRQLEAPKGKGPRVRCERTCSNPMWYADHKQPDDGKQFIAHIDNACRFITAHGTLDHATGAHAIEALCKAIEAHGRSASVPTDHGAQFYTNESVTRKKRSAAELAGKGIRRSRWWK